MTVPLPDDERKVTEAVMKALLLRRKAVREGRGKQMSLDFNDIPFVSDMEQKWVNAADREKANRTIFAQRSLRPEDVKPEWDRARSILGRPEEVEIFVRRGLARLNVPFVPIEGGLRLDSSKLPAAIIDRMDVPATGQVRLLTQGGTTEHLHRTHPLVSALADLLVERSLDTVASPDDPSILPRAGAWTTSAVEAGDDGACCSASAQAHRSMPAAERLAARRRDRCTGLRDRQRLPESPRH